MQFPVPRLRVALLAATVLVAGCGAGGGVAGTSFDPAGPCVADGRRAGAYPALEELVPGALGGRRPDRLDSGRSCTDTALGTLRSHGVAELHFAGGLWELGRNSGTTLVVFDSPTPLEAQWLAEFYEAGARAGRKTEGIESKPVGVAGSDGFRLDTLNDDSYQTVVVWQRADRVAAALVASSVREVTSRVAHEQAVTEALAAFGAPAG